MKTFNNLLLSDRESLSEAENNFLQVHEKILFSATSASAYFVEFSKKLKEMRDGKYYEIAGFENFGEYVEQAVNLKQRQAYKYIEVYEKYTEEFLVNNGSLGVTKLLLLSSLDSEERDNVARQAIEKDLSVEELKNIVEEKNKRISQLELDLKETNAKKISEMDKKADKAKKELEKVLKEKEKLYKELEELKSAPAKVEDKPETIAKLKTITEQLGQKDEEILRLNKKLSLNANKTLVVFKVKFEELQVYLSDLKKLVEEMQEEEKSK